MGLNFSYCNHLLLQNSILRKTNSTKTTFLFSKCSFKNQTSAFDAKTNTQYRRIKLYVIKCLPKIVKNNK